MHIDIIVHDALVICTCRIVHVAFTVHVTRYDMQWHLALNMHGDIALNGLSLWLVNQHCIFCLIGWAQLNGTTSNRVAQFMEMLKKICARYQQVGIDPLLGEILTHYG